MRLPIKGLSCAELLNTFGAAQLSLEGFSRATAEQGSLIQSWVGGVPVEAHEHYPPSDVKDRQRGYQYFYHCHRDNGFEHGHVHMFAHATRSGNRRYMREDETWLHSAPSHLLAVGLDSKGLPISLFTVNRWVTDGHWLTAANTLQWLRKLALPNATDHAPSNDWLVGFVRMYLPVIERLLLQRDRWLARQPDQKLAMNDRQFEILSTARVDWANDLQRLEAEVVSRGLV